MAILDRYLSAEGLKVKRQKLQLIGVSAMFLASKYEEMYNPEIGNFLFEDFFESFYPSLELRIKIFINFQRILSTSATTRVPPKQSEKWR